ncbi:hypothetical protein BZG36_01149 [Bifiguratus adelaidae]|uniref:Dihydroxyacetone kinase n=1 Tax=Bifiguratus adelaidae TaxID=1938954 RepID=A0A261Y644_9FUNG|nr:hypothetical protein BZG36_01149 [Bifiguratus adelaidae]
MAGKAGPKHLLNDAESLVVESLRGLCYANPHLRLLEADKVVYLKNVEEVAQRQVTLISGGGSGHEPAHAAYIDEAMLSAAVCGQVFASPSANQVLAAIRKVKSPHGTLVIVKNYTGDCLHFGLAVERAKAEGIKVDMIIVGDDVAVGREKGGLVGRRGLAATALVHKVAGAFARSGGTLQQVREAAQYVVDNSATIGVGLNHCHVPGSSSESDMLKPNEIEIGMGIHNEPGFEKTNLPTVKKLVEQMLHRILDKNDKDRAYVDISANDCVTLMVNNLGGTPALELGAVIKEATEYLQAQQIRIGTVLSGPFMTSLNMPGFSLTLLKHSASKSLDVAHAIAMPTGAPGWTNKVVQGFNADVIDNTVGLGDMEFQLADETLGKISNGQQFLNAIQSATQSVIEAEPDITHYDTVLGDGDCGQSLKAGALAIQRHLGNLPSDNAPASIIEISSLIDKNMGGTSSAIYCIFLNALAGGVVDACTETKTKDVTPDIWARASQKALDALQKYTPARKGDRTLMDVLIPFIDRLSTSPSVKDALQAAEEGAEATKAMRATLGRASYVNDESVASANVPDAGAWGLLCLLRGLVKGLQQ